MHSYTILFQTCLCVLFTLQQTRTTERMDPYSKGMVFIPGGTFTMGKRGGDDHSPAHEIKLDAFYIDRHEVTNTQYEDFCRETGRRLPEYWNMAAFHSGPDFPDHPVVGISWVDAAAYAEWAGKRLPTEAEWEYAARGGLEAKDYPLGNQIDTTLVNYAFEGRHRGTCPVGSYPPNGYGLFDMAGNVSEWVADFYDAGYYQNSPSKNPKGPKKGKFRVFRGGGWHSGPTCNRVYYRNALPPNWVDINVGFRCVITAHR